MRDDQQQPLIEDTLIPRLTQMARTHKTLFVLHADNARQFAMLGKLQESAEAEAKAQREERDYKNVVQLKQLLETSRITLDTATGLLQWNAEVGALLNEMPADVSIHFSTTQ